MVYEGAGRRILYNACTGKSWSVDDPLCPLVSVGCVVNSTNVWANVQDVEKPVDVAWALADEKAWRPFFGGRGGFDQPEFLASVQTPELTYRRTPAEYALAIERDVNDMLQRAIEDDRGFRSTDWNRSVSTKLKELLRRFELDASGTKRLAISEHDGILERIRASYRLVGLPINCTYTEPEQILRKVRNTNIFMAAGSNLQFALATYVHAYPNQVCSVWVYCACLEDLRAPKKLVRTSRGE